MWKTRAVPSDRQASVLRKAFVLLGVVAVIGIVAGLAAAVPPTAGWPFAGNDLANSRSQPNQPAPNVNNVSKLAVKWAFTTHGDVSATPTVANGVVFFPDFGGFINAVDAGSGKLIWQKKVSDYLGIPGAVSRNSPAVDGNAIIFGDNFAGAQPNGAHVYAVNASNGNLLWATQVDSHPAAQITANPVVADGKVIVGVASNEEADAIPASYPCCSFRGSVVALNDQTGAIDWKTYTVPPNSGPCASPNPAKGCGYSGGAVWDTPAVDLGTGQVFVGTGNNYTTPDAAVTCKDAADANNTSDANCTAPNDYFDSVLSLSLGDGHVIWGRKIEGWDAWNVACAFEPPGATWCPSVQSPDYDFGGAGPNLITIGNGKKTTETLVGVGQKSGVYWAFDEATGAIVWHTLVGPGSSLGGIEWGTAYDGSRIYAPNANYFGIPQTIPGGGTATGGTWAALDPATGKIDWQVATPGNWTALGPASAANGVVYAGDMNPSGNNMFALDASNGKLLWSFAAGGSVNAAPAIVHDTIYWGSGYAHLGLPPWTGNDKLYAFSINGN
jgi:polyvinyl alcohol dehydrogenase (cytochrome)